MAQIRFVDTTIRDGHLSLWANNMRTGMMLPIAHILDRAGFEAIECIYVDARKIVRELKEDPWERLRLLRQHITETPLRVITNRFGTFQRSPEVLWELQMECHARIGIRQARISDDWNRPARWREQVRVAREVGIDPIINLIFSESPKHSDEYYAIRAREVAKLDVYRVCLKDPGGLLTPERMRTLVPAILANVGDKYVELHSHCTTGLGPLNALEAVKLGLRTVCVGVPPLANGTALPSVFNVCKNLRTMGHEPVVDEDSLHEVERHLTYVAQREGFPIGRPVEPDVGQYSHQVPGGMLSNLRHQLRLIGREDRYEAVLEESGRVREDWGYPIMVTPLSQFVGTQAAINVVVGERYKVVSDQAVELALGYWGGEEAINSMNPEVRQKILDLPRAREMAANPPVEPGLSEIREQYGGPGVSDEELLLRFEIGQAEIDLMRSAGQPRPYVTDEPPLVMLLRELADRGDRNFIRIQKEGVSITLGKQAGLAPTS